MCQYLNMEINTYWHIQIIVQFTIELAIQLTINKGRNDNLKENQNYVYRKK